MPQELPMVWFFCYTIIIFLYMKAALPIYFQKGLDFTANKNCIQEN